MITVKVSPDVGDEYTVKVDSRDVYMWERATRDANYTEWEQNPTMVGLYQMTHHAVRRQGLHAGTLDDFVSAHAVAVVTGDDQAEDVDPTRPAASRGTSSRSRSRRA